MSDTPNIRAFFLSVHYTPIYIKKTAQTLTTKGFHAKKNHIKKMEVIPKVSREGKTHPKPPFSIIKNRHF
jgi:hypothetical protein